MRSPALTSNAVIAFRPNHGDSGLDRVRSLPYPQPLSGVPPKPIARALAGFCEESWGIVGSPSRNCLYLFELKQQAFALCFCLNMVDHQNMKRRKQTASNDSRVWGYCRVSTRAQANEGFSLDDQRSRIAGYCQANVLPSPTQFFVDAATSGTVSLQKREQGRGMLEIVRKGDHIVVTRGDRLFRSAKNALEVAEMLRDKGVELHLMDMGGPVLNSSVSRLVFGILMMVANMESERIGERTASVKEHLRKQGRFVGGLVPVGYSKLQDGRLMRHGDWKQLTARMRRLNKQGMSLRKIAIEMQEYGLELSYSTVYAVLNDKRKVDAVRERGNFVRV